MAETNGSAKTIPESFDLRILRQDGPGETSYWERHQLPYEREMNVISALQRVAAQSKTKDGCWKSNLVKSNCGR